VVVLAYFLTYQKSNTFHSFKFYASVLNFNEKALLLDNPREDCYSQYPMTDISPATRTALARILWSACDLQRSHLVIRSLTTVACTACVSKKKVGNFCAIFAITSAKVDRSFHNFSLLNCIIYTAHLVQFGVTQKRLITSKSQGMLFLHLSTDFSVPLSIIFVTKIITRTRIIGRRFQRTRTRIIVIQKIKMK